MSLAAKHDSHKQQGSGHAAAMQLGASASSNSAGQEQQSRSSEMTDQAVVVGLDELEVLLALLEQLLKAIKPTPGNEKSKAIEVDRERRVRPKSSVRALHARRQSTLRPGWNGKGRQTWTHLAISHLGREQFRVVGARLHALLHLGAHHAQRALRTRGTKHVRTTGQNEAEREADQPSHNTMHEAGRSMRPQQQVKMWLRAARTEAASSGTMPDRNSAACNATHSAPPQQESIATRISQKQFAGESSEKQSSGLTWMPIWPPLPPNSLSVFASGRSSGSAQMQQ